MSKNSNKLQTILFIALAVFFGLQFLSRFASSLGSRTGTPGLFKTGAVCFPFEAEPFYRYGKTLLKESPTGDAENAGVAKAIAFLERSLFFNPFDYRAHFELGKTYLSRRPLSEDMFKKGIAGLKRTVRLEGGKSVDVTRRALVLMIDHWQRLNDKEKKRYNRHLILDSVGEKGQKKLKAAKVLVVGAGGLGCPILQ